MTSGGADARTAARPTSVLFAHHGLDWITGSEQCLLDLVRHLDARFRPVVLCNTRALAEAARGFGAAVYSSPAYENPDTLLPSRALVAEARRIIRQEGIGLIHANDFQPVKWLIPAARSARIPILLHVHLPSVEDERCYSWSHQVSRVVGVSRTAVAGFVADGLRPERIEVIYNGVDPARLDTGDASTLRTSLGIAADEIVLAAIGSLIPRKAMDVVLAAVARLVRAGGRRFRLLVLGDGPERARLETIASEEHLDSAVIFVGRRADVGAVLRDATDIAVSASRQEAFPLNVLEAGFFARPIVATDIGPHREAIEDGRTGILVPVDDPEALAAALESLLDDPDLRVRLGRAACERVHARFLISQYVARFMDLYQRLLAGAPHHYGWLGDWVWPAAYSRWVARRVRSALQPRAARVGQPRPA